MEVLFGGFKVIARFIGLGLSQRDHVHFPIAIGVHEDNDHAIENAECDEVNLAVTRPKVLAGDREAVPDRVDADEIQAVVPQIAQALRLVP